MSDRPSIAELQAAAAEMTSPPWRYDHQGWIETMDRTVNHTGAETEVLTLGARNDHGDGEGTAALRNAAPVLLEIAAAAKLWQNWHEVWLARRTDSARSEVDASEELLLAALAKIRE